ncbi:hypothetical protein HK405_002931 [Cladochytrium tenue]|nr:hypothetical protein HK405_002931 [Cladochytrium tenue]
MVASAVSVAVSATVVDELHIFGVSAVDGLQEAVKSEHEAGKPTTTQRWTHTLTGSDQILSTLLIQMALESDMYTLGNSPQENSSELSISDALSIPIHRPGAPDTEVDDLVRRFFAVDFYYISFVHPASHLTRLDSAAPALGLAICAAGALIPGADRDPPLSRKEGMWYYNAARDLVQSAVEQPSVEMIQVALVLTYVAKILDSGAYSKASASWQLLGIASRMCQYLDLNVDPDQLALPTASWVERETRRRCWWACYALDRSASQLLGRPPLLQKDKHSVKPMCKEALWAAAKPPADIGDSLPGDNMANLIIRLGEIYVDAVRLAQEADRTAAFRERVRTEDAALAELECLMAEAPGAWLILGKEGRPAAARGKQAPPTDLRSTAHRAMAVALYHGARCLVLQRRSGVYLRYVGGCGGRRDKVLNEAGSVQLREAERGYEQWVESGLAAGQLARELAFLGLGQLATSSLRSTVLLHAATAVVIAAELEARRADGMGEEGDAVSTAARIADLEEAADALEEILDKMAEIRREARLVRNFLRAMRDRSWGVLAAIETDLGNLRLLLQDGGSAGVDGGTADEEDGKMGLLNVGEDNLAERRSVRDRFRAGTGFIPNLVRTLRELCGVRLEGEVVVEVPAREMRP